MCLFSGILIIQIAVQVQGLFHLHSMKTYNGPENLSNNSLFGFSISSQSQSLYVSDPAANHIGQIYAIDINSSSLTNERVNATIPRNHTLKHDFFLGATIKSKLDTFTVACMPRYAEKKILDYKKKDERNFVTIGFCYLKTLDGVFNEMNVTSVRDRFYKWAGGSKEFVGIEKMDSFGWSVDITPENKVFVGGPAIGQGKLSLYMKPLENLIHPTPIDNKKLSPSEKVLYNLGYSVASGYFFDRKISYAASTTFGDLGYGRVYFFDSKLNNVDVVTDTKFGAMFGAALCTLKLNGKNGLTALLVGAPAFSDFNRLNEYDIGVVYLYVAQNKRMKLSTTIKGKRNGGYFGFSIINLGDMDGDNNDEIAISAPYENEGSGAIYIYSSTGILTAKYSQKLVGEPWFPNFGYSITIVKDIDDNGCNELAVSSPKNNKIVMLKSIPSITVTIRTEFPDFQGIAIEKGFHFNCCVDVIYPEKPTKIEAELIVSMEIHANATLEGAVGKEYIYTQSLETRKSTYCNGPIGIKFLAIDRKSHRIPYKISAKLKEDPLVLEHFNPSRVLLSERSNLIVSDVIWINDCGERNCNPNLSLEISTNIPETYLIGSSDSENLSLFITNYGETAYEPCVVVAVPNAAIIKRPSGCTIRNAQEIKCTRSRPLRNNKIWRIEDIIIETKQLTSRDENLVIQYDLFNKCSDKSSNKISNDTFKLISDASGITIKNVTNPEEFTVITRSDIELGKTVEHHYTISNEGKTNWVDVGSNITLKTIAYVKYYEISINVFTEKSWISCAQTNSNEIKEDWSVFCDIDVLGVQKSARVVISVMIPPKTLDLNDDNKNISIVSNINLQFKDERKSSSLNTLLLLRKEKVPIWIIVMASMIGFIIFSVIVFLLYKCGFLQRKNKDELNRLRKDVYRQSVRRSIMRESMRATANRRSTEEVQFQKLTEPEHSEESEIK